MRQAYPPGPSDGLLGMRTMARMKRDVLGAYVGWQREYGDQVSFRTGPYRLFVFYHPDQVREVLVTQARCFQRLPRVMRTFAQWNGNSLLISEGNEWLRQRRLIQPAFQPRRLAGYADAMVAAARRLVDDWLEAIDRDGSLDIDMDRAMTALTLEIIGRTLFDTEMRTAADDIARAVAILSEVAFHEMQAPLRMPIWWPTSFHRRKRWAMRTLDEIVWRIVRERRREGRDHGDLLSMLLAAVDEEGDGGRLDDREVRDAAMTLMLAGHDTTAAALDWLWHCLATHPDEARRCQEELDTVLGDRAAIHADVPRLARLGAVIKETLRLYPPAIGVFLRQATNPVTIGDAQVPRGGLVTLSSFVTQRDARWFAEPERFDPGRFLPPRADELPVGAYFPFGAGPRACIGQAFALTELTLVAATLLQRLDVSPIPDFPTPRLQVHVSLRPQPLVLRWRRRL